MRMAKGFGLIGALLLLACGAGCSTPNESSPYSLVGPDGRHFPGWIAAHGAMAGTGGGPCFSCHGNDLLGGISGVSCYSATVGAQPCHPLGPGFHPATWLDKGFLGTTSFHAKAYQSAVPVQGHPCTDCHTPPGLDTAGGFCRRCHFDISGRRTPLSGSSYSHGALTGHSVFGTTVSVVCVACHSIDNRFGYPPFCHDCHEPFPTAHPAGWAAASQHGAAAKGKPSSSAGFPFCQGCHGDDFKGGISGQTCLSTSSCHGVARPHPGPAFWSGHTSTDGGNAIACALCHRSAQGAAGCFNSTLCHGNQN